MFRRSADIPRAANIPPIPPAIKSAFWAYFNANTDRVVLSLYKGFLTVRLGQLRPVFEAIFGRE
jgi:hypothetical protein